MTEYESYTEPCPSRRMQYFSRREVLGAANGLAERGRDDHYFYCCGRCGWWHLTRQAPQQSKGFRGKTDIQPRSMLN